MGNKNYQPLAFHRSPQRKHALNDGRKQLVSDQWCLVVGSRWTAIL